MRGKIGDVVIDRSYRKSGRLAVVVGEGIYQPILIHHSQGITMDRLGDYFSTWDGLEVIGHIDFEKVWAEAVRIADRKTESDSEKPNNCETCKHNHKEWWELPCDWCCGTHGGYEPKTEPQTDCAWGGGCDEDNSR